MMPRHNANAYSKGFAYPQGGSGTFSISPHKYEESTQRVLQEGYVPLALRNDYLHGEGFSQGHRHQPSEGEEYS